MSRRVAIWGVGIDCPAGTGWEEVAASVATARRSTGPVRNFDASRFPPNAAGEVKRGGEVERLPTSVDRKVVFLEESLRQLAHSPALSAFPPEKRHFFVGMGLDYLDISGLAKAGEHRMAEFLHSSVKGARELSQRFGIIGDFSVNVTACIASSQALGLALRRLRQEAGAGSVVFAGGADSMVNPVHYMGFYKLGALSGLMEDPSRASRPFDVTRSGLVLGEGAALYALSRLEDAPKGAALAELAGYASTMDAYMLTDPDPTGTQVARAALAAIGDAGLTPDEIDCVHLHGTSTPKNDPAEAAAMKLIFGERFSDIPVYSMKGQVGHTISACGAIELAPVIWSLANQAVPVTVNFEEADPNVPLRVVRGGPLKMRINNILKLNAAFGGQNVALVIKRHDS